MDWLPREHRRLQTHFMQFDQQHIVSILSWSPRDILFECVRIAAEDHRSFVWDVVWCLFYIGV